MSSHNIENISRLSPLQEGILFHVIEATVPGVYLQQYCCDIAGELDTARLSRAWEEVAARHAALRMLFTWEQRDHPLQIVRARVQLPWHIEDWRQEATQERERRWQSLLARDRDRGFDLREAPLMRLALIRFGPTRYRFLWTFHHLLVDGWSMRIVLDEVRAIYRHGSAAAAGLAPAPGFPAFIEWLRKQDPAGAEQFWRLYLHGFHAPLELDLGGGAAASAARGPREMMRKMLPATLTAALAGGARRERLTLSTLVFGAWAIVLGRYTGCTDVLFGSTVSGRPAELPDADRMVGMLINTLPLRVKLDQEQGRVDWLRRLQSDQVRARVHEHTSLADIQRWSAVGRGTALFETIVVFENVPAPSTVDPPYAVSAEEFHQYSQYPLALLVVPGETMELLCVHDPARFPAVSVARLLDHFATAVEALCEPGNRPLSEVRVLSSEESARLSSGGGFSRQQAKESGPLTDVLDLIAEAAARAPSAPAVVSSNESITYAAFLERAAGVAEALQSRGVGPGVCVPVLAERSSCTVVAILGVLAAGAGYALIDAELPDDRIEQMLAELVRGDAQTGLRCADCLLVARDSESRRAAGGLHMLAVAVLPPSPKSRLRRHEAPNDDLAYVIFTSGSTGKPKGVKVSRQNLAFSLRARQSFYDQPPGRYLLVSPVATDSAIVGLYWPLVAGGTVVLAAPRLERDVLRLGDAIADFQISHLLCLPSLHALLLEYVPAAKLSSLTTVIVAGEACSASVVARHARVLPATRLFNEYGPAETTIWASAAELDDDEVARRGFVPIGRAIPGARTYVLNSQHQLLPLGVTGELAIGGPGVGLGYWNDPEGTAARFLSDPFAAEGGRMYRTGDRVRLHEDGQFEFSGRVDYQVKVRGHRVEPEEIEAVLREHPQVREAVVFARDLRGRPAAAGEDEPSLVLGELLAHGRDRALSLLDQLARLSDEEVAAALEQTPVPGDSRAGGARTGSVA